MERSGLEKSSAYKDDFIASDSTQKCIFSWHLVKPYWVPAIILNALDALIYLALTEIQSNQVNNFIIMIYK